MSDYLSFPPPLDLGFRPPSFVQALAQLPPTPAAAHAAADTPFWDAVSRLYLLSRRVANLEHGYWGVMAEPVQATYRHWSERVNHDNTVLLRQHGAQAMDALGHTLAAALGCASDEVALTRGATESLQVLIGGFNGLRAGDTVLYSNLDYPAACAAMQWLRLRRGVRPVCLQLPDFATHADVLAAYDDALRTEPRVRLVLLTHLSHRTGLVLPVRELAQRAHAAGAAVIVDAAQSWGQLAFDITDLGAEFAVVTLHKWVGAPLGCGAIYIRRGSVGLIDPHCADPDMEAADIASRVRTGSVNFAAWLTLPAALQLHQRIGAAAKHARLRHLRDHWVRQARALQGIEVMTPDDPSMVAGITSFRLRGRHTLAQCQTVVAELAQVHGVHTVTGTGSAGNDVIRVTPHITTTHAELDRLVAALAIISGHSPGK